MKRKTRELRRRLLIARLRQVVHEAPLLKATAWQIAKDNGYPRWQNAIIEARLTLSTSSERK